MEANKNVDEEEKLIRSIGDLDKMRKTLKHQKLEEEILSAGGHLDHHGRSPITILHPPAEEYVYHLNEPMPEFDVNETQQQK